MPASEFRVDLAIQPNPLIINQQQEFVEISADLMLTNTSPVTWTVRGIELHMFKDDTLLYTRSIDENGSPPGIETIARRSLLPNSTRCVFNPFQTLLIEHVGDQLRWTVYLTADSDEEEVVRESVYPLKYTQAVGLVIPLRGRVLVDDGHDMYSHHRRVATTGEVVEELGINKNFQRFAIDFLSIDKCGVVRTDCNEPEGFFCHRPPECRLEDYIGFGQAVRSPADGTVVKVADGMPDQEPWNPAVDIEEMADDPSLAFGNTVVIDHGEGEYSLLGHLQSDTIRVEDGTTVEQDEHIGNVGNSGWSYYPHLHYQLMDGPDPITDLSLPARFDRYTSLTVANAGNDPSSRTPLTGEVLLT